MLRFALLLLAAAPAFAQAPHWRAVDIDAHLQRDGSLHVRERQQIVFNGEPYAARSFLVRKHLWLELKGIRRIDEQGREVALEETSVDAADHYQRLRGEVYRWRAPVDRGELTYVLDYTWHNTLVPVDATHFRLDRQIGLTVPTDALTLRLDFDPVWNTPPIVEQRANLEAGERLTLERLMMYSGGTWPADIQRLTPWWLRALALLLYAVGAALLIRKFIRDERETGRFEPIAPQLDPELLRWKPEIAGAIWDARVGPPEVAATLARMSQEKKLATRVEHGALLMDLLVPRDTLESYERYLVDALFVDGNSTSMEVVKAHYERTGFDPSAVIRPRIEWELAQLPGWNGNVRRMNPIAHVLLFAAAGFALVVAGLLGHSGDFELAMSFGFTGSIVTALACVVGWRMSRAIDDYRSAFAIPAVLAAIPLMMFAAGLLQPGSEHLGKPIVVMVPLWLLTMLHLILATLRIRQPREVIAYRRRIAAARRFFLAELKKPQPSIRDEWFPYVLAFGLASSVDEWFRAHGAGLGSEAGAQASWAMAAATVASGVSAPSRHGGGSW
ncbi:MAG TPA: hypothetical protein VND45_17325 [Thermoanaerobaculia bacterium]|nr:hypothetical protein [Thermoanaerobaculia bacterium]